MRGVASSKPNTQSRCFNDHLLKLQCRSQHIHFEEQQYCQVQTLCDNNAETLFIIAACLGKYAIPQHDAYTQLDKQRLQRNLPCLLTFYHIRRSVPIWNFIQLIYYRQAEGEPRATLLRTCR